MQLYTGYYSVVSPVKIRRCLQVISTLDLKNYFPVHGF